MSKFRRLTQLSNKITYILIKSSIIVILFAVYQFIEANELKWQLKQPQFKDQKSKILFIKNTLHIKFPDLKITSLTASELPNIYQVIAGNHIFYIDENANYLLLGNIISLKDNTNITSSKLNKLNKINWHLLDKSVAIVHYPANNKIKHEIAVFLDPDCPFCVSYLTDVLLKLNNVIIYYYLIPLKIHPDSALHVKQILNSPNPESAMIEYMVNNRTLTNNSINHNSKFNQNIDIAKNVIDLQGTPTTVLQDGTVIAGTLNLKYLQGLLN